nr:ATP synthase F0 subunit 8 [Onchidium reevesii]
MPQLAPCSGYMIFFVSLLILGILMVSISSSWKTPSPNLSSKWVNQTPPQF